MVDTPARKPLTAAFRKPWLGAFLLMTLVFVCGLVVGVVSTSAFFWNRAFDSFRQPGGREIESLMKAIQYELLLSPEQSNSLKQIFESHNERIRAIRDEAEPKLQAEQESLYKSVEAALSPEQAKRWKMRFDEMVKEFRRPPRPQEGPPPPRPPAPGNGEQPPRPDGQPPGPPRQGPQQQPFERPAPPPQPQR